MLFYLANKALAICLSVCLSVYARRTVCIRLPVTTVGVEGAEDTDARVAFVAVEADWFIDVWTTLNLLLYLGVEHRVTACYLHRHHNNNNTPIKTMCMLDRGYNTIKHCDKTAKTKSTTVDCFSVLALLQLLHVPATTLR